MRLLIFIFFLIIGLNSFSQTQKQAPTIVHKNMDWYKITFDVVLDNGESINHALINSIDFNPLENQRQESTDVEIEVEVDGEEIEIILYSYQKCATKKDAQNNTNPEKE